MKIKKGKRAVRGEKWRNLEFTAGGSQTQQEGEKLQAK